MQSVHLSHSSSSAEPTNVVSASPSFVITSADAEILQEYLVDFEEATGNSSARTKIVERAMAQIYLLRPEDTQFNKAAARPVRHT